MKIHTLILYFVANDIAMVLSFAGQRGKVEFKKVDRIPQLELTNLSQIESKFKRPELTPRLTLTWSGGFFTETIYI